MEIADDTGGVILRHGLRLEIGFYVFHNSCKFSVTFSLLSFELCDIGGCRQVFNREVIQSLVYHDLAAAPAVVLGIGLRRPAVLVLDLLEDIGLCLLAILVSNNEGLQYLLEPEGKGLACDFLNDLLLLT